MHGNVTFVCLWWPDWVTVLTAVSEKTGEMVGRGRRRRWGSQGTFFFSMTRCQSTEDTNLSPLSCFGALFPNGQPQKAALPVMLGLPVLTQFWLSLIQPLVLWRSHLHAEREHHS